MRNYQEWMDAYAVDHQNPTNQAIHKICVPLILLSVIGMLWSIPYPNLFQIVPFMNWATIFIVSCLIFYLSLNLMMFAGMFLQSILMCSLCYWLEQKGILLNFSIIVFVMAWIGQFIGHKIEGRKPSFLQDLVFLLIGPLWVLRFLYRRLGINV